MSENNITINTNQSPYFDDFDDNKNFHQVMYKPSLPVQARELTTQQSIHRDQIKKLGDHVFKNGSKVTGADVTLNLDYEFVKLQNQLNGVDINVANFIQFLLQCRFMFISNRSSCNKANTFTNCMQETTSQKIEDINTKVDVLNLCQ